MKILFLSRAFPPVIGGIENQNAGLAKYLPRHAEVTTIANTRGKKFLPFFLPWATVRALFLMRRHDAMLLGDGVLGPVGAFVSIFHPRKKFVSVIHGLDITYARKKSLMGRLYRSVNIPSLKMLDRLIMVGNETIEQATQAGIDRTKCVFIPNGIEPDALHKHVDLLELEKLLAQYRKNAKNTSARQNISVPQQDGSETTPSREDARHPSTGGESSGSFPSCGGVPAAGEVVSRKNEELFTKNKTIILRVGRFVRHKGVLWFLENVMPKLPETFVFVAAGGVVSNATAGDANIFPLCKQAIKRHRLERRAFLFSNIAQKDLVTLFNTCDLYVSPNIPVPGSLEGFGINLLEAASCEKVVLASNHEGLKDAVIDGKNGFLLPPEDAAAWINKIQDLAKDAHFLKTFGASARRYTAEHFSWDGIAKKYIRAIENIE